VLTLSTLPSIDSHGTVGSTASLNLHVTKNDGDSVVLKENDLKKVLSSLITTSVRVSAPNGRTRSNYVTKLMVTIPTEKTVGTEVIRGKVSYELRQSADTDSTLFDCTYGLGVIEALIKNASVKKAFVGLDLSDLA